MAGGGRQVVVTVGRIEAGVEEWGAFAWIADVPVGAAVELPPPPWRPRLAEKEPPMTAIDPPDLDALAGTDAAVEIPRLTAGGPCPIPEMA